MMENDRLLIHNNVLKTAVVVFSFCFIFAAQAQFNIVNDAPAPGAPPSHGAQLDNAFDPLPELPFSFSGVTLAFRDDDGEPTSDPFAVDEMNILGEIFGGDFEREIFIPGDSGSWQLDFTYGNVGFESDNSTFFVNSPDTINGQAGTGAGTLTYIPGQSDLSFTMFDESTCGTLPDDCEINLGIDSSFLLDGGGVFTLELSTVNIDEFTSQITGIGVGGGPFRA